MNKEITETKHDYSKIEGSKVYIGNISYDFSYNYGKTEFTFIDKDNKEHKIIISGTIREAIKEYSKGLNKDIYIDYIKINRLEEIEVPF